MIPTPDWFSRPFSFNDLTIHAYPGIIERLRGTPARLADRLSGLSHDILTRQDGGEWSIQEHVGHLLDLGELDLKRIDAYAEGVEVLPAADLENRKTYDADHNSRSLADILADFRRERAMFVGKLSALDEVSVQRTALHPRLRVHMRILDFAYFVAEHDDHHLAQISVINDKIVE